MTAHPDDMRALVLTSYGQPPYPLVAQNRPSPKPRRGEVLVRVAASPVNPSDLHFLEGEYAYRRALPTVPGIEGSGQVVAVGPGLLARRLAGRRVAFAVPEQASGTWAQYAVASAMSCFRLPQRISDEQGAMGLVNPLAATGLIERVKALKSQAFVSTAAASALGQMLLRQGTKRGLEVINIVRRPEQAMLLQQLGARHVLNSAEPAFPDQLTDIVRSLKARVALDAISGETTTQLLAALPPGGRVIIYGGLARQPSMLTSFDVVFSDKSIEGFYVPTWLRRKSLPQLFMLERRLPRLLDTELRTDVRARVSLDEAPGAINKYATAMTGGKVLILPNKGGAV